MISYTSVDVNTDMQQIFLAGSGLHTRRSHCRYGSLAYTPSTVHLELRSQVVRDGFLRELENSVSGHQRCRHHVSFSSARDMAGSAAAERRTRSRRAVDSGGKG